MFIEISEINIEKSTKPGKFGFAQPWPQDVTPTSTFFPFFPVMVRGPMVTNY